MLSSEFVSALKAVCDALPLDEINWAVCGEASLALHGIETIPAEINLLTTRHGAYEIERRLRRFVMKSVEYAQDPRSCSHFGMLSINGFSSEIIGSPQLRRDGNEWTSPVDPVKVRTLIEIDGFNVPVTTLEYEIRCRKDSGDDATAAMIEGFQSSKAGV